MLRVQWSRDHKISEAPYLRNRAR